MENEKLISKDLTKEQLEKELKKILDKMDIPKWKKEVENQHCLYWLIRNIGIRNSGHEKYNEAIKIIKKLLNQ